MLKRNSREEERIERIIRGLIKLPQNKRCINCNSLGPQYVCTTFWTFVCTNCSGVHREFTHRVKSVSMAKFSADEVAALQAGGNEQARKTYLKTWDPRRNSFPDSSNLHKLRDFIRHVYIDHKYSDERNNEKVSQEKTGAKDDSIMQQPPVPSSLVAKENFFERRTPEKTDQTQTDESFDRRRSFGDFSIINRDKNTRRYVEETSIRRYGDGNVRNVNRRRRGTANFEVVDDRFRDDDEVRNGRRLGSNRSSDSDLRDRSSSPVTEKRSSTCPPPSKGNLHNKTAHPKLAELPKLAEPPKTNKTEDVDDSTQVQKEASSSTSAPSSDKKTHRPVNSLNLIDFDANPESSDSTAVVQSQQIVPYGERDSVSAPASRNETTTNIRNSNSTDLLFLELSSSIGPSGSTSERPLQGDTPSYVSEGSSNSQVGSGSIVPVNQAQLSNMYQNLSLSVPPGNGSSTSLDKQPLGSELALVSVPPTSQGVSVNEPVSGARKELPADIFAASHSSYATGAPGWQYHPHYGMGYGAMVPVNSVKSRNPFDLGDDGPQYQAPTYPQVPSYQEVVPRMSAAQNSWAQQPLQHQFVNNSHPMSYQMMPPGAYMGQQLPNNMLPSSVPQHQPANNSHDAFASINPIRAPNISNSASTRPLSYPSKRDNPFG